jgi:hypothetical protein
LRDDTFEKMFQREAWSHPLKICVLHDGAPVLRPHPPTRLGLA